MEFVRDNPTIAIDLALFNDPEGKIIPTMPSRITGVLPLADLSKGEETERSDIDVVEKDFASLSVDSGHTVHAVETVEKGNALYAALQGRFGVLSTRKILGPRGRPPALNTSDTNNLVRSDLTPRIFPRLNVGIYGPTPENIVRMRSKKVVPTIHQS